jgi:Heparinase II/III-like protein/Heparinase II/III N-terminus
MTKTLARLARMGPHEIHTRTRQALSKRIDLLRSKLVPPACPLTTPSSMPVFFDPPAACPPGLLDQAETICRRRFDLLGYQGLDFGRDIDWHLDPVHHKRAPRLPWYRIPFLDFDRVGDHKIIWELNRHQHLVTLAEAWWFTKQDRYAAELLAQWHHWQRENPYPIGINWASTLEVAFRALSWLWVRYLLIDCPAVPQSFHDDLLRALHVHAWYIERYLSTYFAPNTHLLGEGVTLFSIGLLCPQFRAARSWQAHGWEIVLRQAEAQVLPDGFHFEQSVYYHVYALDFFRFARDLAARNAVPIPAAFDRTIENMRAALAAISQAGLPPRFGDDDGGRVIMPREAIPQPASAGSVALKSCGIYAMTSARSQLFIDAGPHGAFTGGHGHADALSIQLVTAGRPVLIDPGTFCYVCPERDRFRGTAAHNTLQVDGRDQAQPLRPFAWAGIPKTTVDRWASADTFDLFAGHHDGYAPVIHHRWVFGLKNRFWLVRDIAAGSGRHRLDLPWHFLDERDLAILPPAGHPWSQSIERFDWSPVYGRKEPAFVLRFSVETSLPAEFAVLLVPREIAGTFTQLGPGVYHYEETHASHDFLFAERFTYRGGAGEISV